MILNTQQSHCRTLRAIALFEVTKGAAAVAASWGLLSVAHHDLRHFTYLLIHYLHLDLNAYYLKTIDDFTDLLANENLRVLVLIALAYAAMRFTEAYGLWKNRVWAEWLAALSGGIYLPFEVNHLVQHANSINAAVLLTNAVVVAYMVYRFWRRMHSSAHRDKPVSAKEF